MAGPKGRKCRYWQNVYSPVTGGMVRRCASYDGKMGEMADLGQVGTTLKASFDAVKDVAVAALIGVAGAVAAYKGIELLGPYVGLKDEVTGKVNMESVEADIGIGILGLGGGILFTRFILPAKPNVGTNIAIGAMVLMGVKLLLRLTGKQVMIVEVPEKKTTTTTGLIETELPGFKEQYRALQPVAGLINAQTASRFRPQFAGYA